MYTCTDTCTYSEQGVVPGVDGPHTKGCKCVHTTMWGDKDDMGSQVNIHTYTHICMHYGSGVKPDKEWLGNTYSSTQLCTHFGATFQRRMGKCRESGGHSYMC